LTWTTDAGPFDVLADLKNSEGKSVPYEDLVSRSLVIRGDGFLVNDASVDDIIAAKSFTNREKDREALPELIDGIVDTVLTPCIVTNVSNQKNFEIRQKRPRTKDQ
jgi:hypothetical protein